MAKQKAALLASITVIAILIAVIFGGCGQKPEDIPVDNSISSETDETRVDESVEAPAEPEKTTEKSEPETPASTEEEVVLTSDNYLAEMSQGDSFEFKYSDYNPEYEVGNRITLTVEMESTGMFNGCIGSCVGSSYEWQQEEFEFEAGRHTATWTVTPSLDEGQLNLWFADSAPVGVISIDVTIEEVEPAVIGRLATFTEQDTFEFTFSEYNSEYKVGDLVKISVVMESDGDFNGSIGASVGRDYTWNQKEFRYDEGGKYTLSWTVKPSSDYSNIGIWWVGGTSVGIHSITVTVLEEEIGIHGSYITMFTDEGNFEFIPSLINPSFKFGDKIKITVTLESDGEFTGSLGTCVGSDYEWTQTEYESDAGISTWVLEISPVIDSVQLGIWYIDGTAVGILDIDIEIQKWGYQHKDINGLIYTSTEKNDSYSFMPSDYCDFEDGDIITIRVELKSNDVFNGCVGVNDINGTYRSANYSSGGSTVFCELVVEASTKEEARIEFWWMNTKVALNSITVTKGGTIVDTNDDDIYHPGEVTKFRTASDYCDYTAGDTITVTVTLSGDGYFNGALGMAGIDWIQKDFESKNGSPVTCTITVPNAVSKPRDIQIGIWWSEGSYVKIENVTVTRDSSGGNEDDNTPDDTEQIDTSGWQLAFNGFTSDWGGWNSVNGDAGKLEFQTTVQDIMTANNIADISEFGGFLFQIWHVDSKYDGRTYTYRLDINGNTYKDGEGTIKCSEYNSTDVIRITADDYAFTPTDVIHGVITVSEEEVPDVPTESITIFEGGQTDESYESDDASWLLNADDNSVITIVYTCDESSNAGWGILGWGASVDGAWNDGPQYSADGSNASKELTVRTTAAKLREALGITAGSQVTFIKLGAWSSGRIISLSISETSGAEAPDTAIYTFKYDEWKAVKAEDPNGALTYSFMPNQYGEFADGDTINVTVTLDSDSKAFNGALGASNGDAAPDNWITSGQLDNNSGQWTLKIPNAVKNNNAQIQIWYMDDDTAYVKVTDIKVEKAETDNPDKPDEPDEPDDEPDTSNWALAFCGFDANWGGWNGLKGNNGNLEFSTTVQEIMDANSIDSIDGLLGFQLQIWDVDSKDNGKTYSYKLSINGNVYSEGEATIDCSEYNSTTAIQVTTSDYTFSASDVITGVISVSSGGSEEPDVPDDSDADVVFNSSITGTAAASIDWDGVEIALSTLIGNTKPSTITSIEFFSDKPFNVGYNGSNGWTQVENSTSYNLTDIATDGFFLKIVFTAKDDADHTVSWKVHAEESDAPVATVKYATDSEKKWAFSLSDYVVGLEIGDEVEIVAKFESSSTGGWGGGLGAACEGAEDNWNHTEFSNNDPTVTLTVTIPATDDNHPNTGAQVELWWGDADAEVDIYIVSVTKTGAAATTALEASPLLFTADEDESEADSTAKSNAIAANGEANKNMAPDSTNNQDGTPTVSGNDAGEAADESFNTVSGNDTACAENEDSALDNE